MDSGPKRAAVFVDGQNLFYSVKHVFGYSYPNYDVMALAKSLAQKNRWQLGRVRFYTGVPGAAESPKWHEFWARKLAQMGRTGVDIFTRQLRYRPQRITRADGGTHVIKVADEKGIDVRIAIDIIRATNNKEFDVAIILSQDQDLSEVVDEMKRIARDQGRDIKIICAYPIAAGDENNRRRGINGTEWLGFRKQDYDPCIDPRSYSGVGNSGVVLQKPPRP